MSVTVYKKSVLTGGAAGALDSIDGTALLDGDMGFVNASGILYTYILDDDLGGAESSPRIITPDTNAGNKRWVLQKANIDGVTVTGGTNTINLVNGTAEIDAATGAALSITGTAQISDVKGAPSISGGDVDLDCTKNIFAVALTAAITSFTTSDLPASGQFYAFLLEFTADGTARSVTWSINSVAVKWASGDAPTLTSTNTKRDVFVFFTYDAGSTWTGAIVGQNL